MKSIIQADKERCYLCGRNNSCENLDEHHVFFGPYRSKSEKYGLKVYLHHQRCHLDGVHRSSEICRMVQERVQRIAMKHYGWTEDEFRSMFGRSYLEDL
jgi:hypothetical protein